MAVPAKRKENQRARPVDPPDFSDPANEKEKEQNHRKDKKGLLSRPPRQRTGRLINGHKAKKLPFHLAAPRHTIL